MLIELARDSGTRTLPGQRTPTPDAQFPVSAGQKLLFVDHHEAHAWSTYALSGFDDALVLVVDGRGARQATSLYHASAGRLKRLRTIDWPNSLGSFYEAFTDLLGFERYGDEWKVMGLAAYGEPTHDLNPNVGPRRLPAERPPCARPPLERHPRPGGRLRGSP